MAGVPPIPPLVCNTPPPIDFGDEEDDSGLPPTLTFDDEDDFGDFALAIETNEDSTNADVSSLPRTPLQYELSSSTTSGFTDAPPTLEEYGTASPASLTEMPRGAEPKSANNNAVSKPNEAFNYDVVANLQTNVFKPSTAEAVQPNNYIEIETSAAAVATSTAPVPPINADNKQKTNVSTTQSNLESPTESTKGNDSQIGEVTAATIADISSANIVENATNVDQDVKSIDADAQNVTSLTNVVLEDLADDSSDEECHRSPKKSPAQSPKLDENSEDFFAIHIVDEAAVEKPTNEKVSASAANIEVIYSNSCAISNNDSTTDANSFDSVDFNDDANFNADFSQFADFKAHSPTIAATDYAAPADATNTNNEKNGNAKEGSNNEIVDDVAAAADDDADDDFDDFQDFATAAVTVTPPSADTQAASPPKCDEIATAMNTLKHADSEEHSVTAIQQEDNEDEDDDDDFGDFEEASFAAPAAVTFNTSVKASQPDVKAQEATTSLPTLAPDSNNLQDRLNSLLHMMFPANDKQQNVADGNDLNTQNATQRDLQRQSSADALPLKSVETAKALEFQWPNSEMRHALIRAIGIDSRNILFGENWNPAMPRFAANLSFNPLKPMKPQSSSSSAGNTISNAEMEAAQYGNGGNVENMVYPTKSDVPEVEFDWQSAGLVNPLEGLKGEADTRETETIHTPPPEQSDASDDKLESCSAYANVDDHFSETLNNETELATTTTTATATANTNAKDHCKSAPLDVAFTLAQKEPENNAKRALTPLHFSATIDDIEDETVATSTFAGPLKETHIYTPSKSEIATSKTKTVSGSEPIDFDYEIAAAGIIIDETVVKKEYRDVEYNPGFSLEPANVYAAEQLAVSAATNPSVPATFSYDSTEPAEASTAHVSAAYDCDEFTEFTEFQSVPPPTSMPPSIATNTSAHAASKPTNVLPSTFGIEPMPLSTATVSVSTPVPLAVAKTREQSRTPSRTSSPSIIDNMILSPAILLPQAIPISTSSNAPAPSIEWGNSTASINPEELARIEELFPQPKISATTNDVRREANSSQKSSPAHSHSGDGSRRADKQELNSLSISATVAQKEQDSSLNDDYWSDFVSVPVPQANANNIKNNNNNINNNNNNHLVQTPKRAAVNSSININSYSNANANINSNSNATSTTPRHHHKHFAGVKLTAAQHRANALAAESSANNCNDDDWSDFVSSTPASAHAPMSSAAAALGYMGVGRAPQFNSAAWQNANFYNNPIGLYHHAQQSAAAAAAAATQQIHIMQDFSTMPATRPQVSNLMHNSGHNLRNNIVVHAHSNHALQVGNARIAPSISLIPDLGFVAPAMPVHTAFVNVLPKPSFNGKK